MGDRAPAFSPDGRTIAFSRVIPSGGGGIYVVPAAGGEPTRVTAEQHFWLERLAWLPTGRELLFSSGATAPESNSSLWSVSASGGSPERLGIGGDNAANPAVSPRANRLAYEQPRRDANIWKIALPQSTRPPPAPTKLIASSRDENAPHVSPDGARIAFLSNRSGSDEIWLCDTAGSNLVQLTTSGGSFGTPQWSPDSRQLAFEGVKPPGIYVIGVEGGLPRQVTTDPSVLPSWSSDGRWIYFASNRTGNFEIWKVPAGGGRAVQVTKRGGFRAFESADGTFVYYAMGYAKDADVGGVWKVPVNGGEETAILDLPKVEFWGYWALVKDGIYFVDAEASPRPALRFFDFGSSRVSHVVDLDKKPIEHEPGLAISPDGKWLLYTQMDSRSGDIMLVDNFR
jgi:Tol biopolymer transport system component